MGVEAFVRILSPIGMEIEFASVFQHYRFEKFMHAVHVHNIAYK